MIVDSGVWIDHFLNRGSAAVALLRDALGAGRAVLLTPQILQEVLQGTRDAAQFARYEGLLAPVPFAPLADARAAAVLAGRLYARLRWDGITIPAPDCQIASAAICSDAPLLTSDPDFGAIRRIEPRLRLLKE